LATGFEAVLFLPRMAVARMALLEKITRSGSISAAARDLGLSYRAAWDAVQALNNLFDEPLVTAAPGGKSGGRATVTPQGHAVLAAFQRVQAELDSACAKLDQEVGADVFWSLGMRTSARNALRGQITAVTIGPVNAEVTLRVSDDLDIVAVVTASSVEDLGLRMGVAVIALIKSSFVILAKGEDLRTSTRNQLQGRVAVREDGAVHSDIQIELGRGKTLSATITRTSADRLGLEVGDQVTALIKSSHVILAIE